MRKWFTLHSWVGLKFYLVLTFLLGSGTLAVVAHEIDWLLYPEMRVEPRGERVSLDRIVAALESAEPGATLLDGFVATSIDHPRTAAVAVAVSPTEGVRRYWVDPYTGECRGSTPILSPGFLVAQAHQSLFVPIVGSAIVTCFALFLTTSLATGLVVYRRWWREFRRLPSSRGPRVWMGEMHRLLGVWSLAFLALIAVTSLVYFYDYVGEQQLGLPARDPHPPPPEVPAETLARLGPVPPERLSLDALTAIVEERAPGLEVVLLSLPMHPTAAITYFGTMGEWVTESTASSVVLDPYTGAVLEEELLRDGSTFRRVNHSVDPLHYGDFGGLWSKLAWVAFGSALTALALTGVLVHLRRIRARSAARREERARATPMGRLRWVNVAFLALGGVSLFLFHRFVTDPWSAGGVVRLGERSAGAWTASLSAIDELAVLGRSDPLRAGSAPLVEVRVAQGRGALVRSATLRARANGGDLETVRLEGRGDSMRGSVRLPGEIGEHGELVLVIEGWDASRAELRWPLRQEPST